MNITLFKEITTEDALVKLEADGEKYTGLYVDMDKPKERKYVKDSASLISDLLKKVERARIDKSRDYKASVEAEAKSITERLEAANKPFSLLIDAHKEKRAQELAKEKADIETKALSLQIEADHDHALMMEKVMVIEVAEQEQARQAEVGRLAQEQKDREIKLKAEAAENARIEAEQAAQVAINKANFEKQEAIRREATAKEDAERTERLRIETAKRTEDARLAAIEQAEHDAAQAVILAQEQAEAAVKAEQDRVAEIARVETEEQAKRDRNTKHKGAINRQAAADLVANAGITEAQAKEVVKAIAKKQISAVSISY